MAQRFRKKPVVIEAVQFRVNEKGVGNHIEIATFVGKTLRVIDMGDTIIIPTLEGDMEASIGDWIIKGIKGEFYPCKPDIFEATYDLVSADQQPVTG